MTMVDPRPRLRVELPVDELTLDDVSELAAADREGHEDRLRKPAEYAGAGIPHFWRIERDAGLATVHMFALGLDERGERSYIGHEAVLLERLLEGAPPKLA